MGDFNYPNIEWNDLHASSDCSEFLDLVMDNFLYQHVHFRAGENNILDLLITSDPNMVNKLECVGKLGSSDHVLILAELNFLQKTLRQYPTGKKANMDRIKESLNVNWEQKFEGKDTQLCWNEFKTFLHDSAQKNVPMKKRRTKSKKKVWITRKIVRQIRKKTHLYMKCRLTRKPQTQQMQRQRSGCSCETLTEKSRKSHKQKMQPTPDTRRDLFVILYAGLNSN